MQTFEDYTAHPSAARLPEILSALDREPNVLVVFNHPMWDLYMIGKEKHEFLVNEFIQKYGVYLHAVELNGLRNWDENRTTRRLAEKWNMLLISGDPKAGAETTATAAPRTREGWYANWRQAAVPDDVPATPPTGPSRWDR